MDQRSTISAYESLQEPRSLLDDFMSHSLQFGSRELSAGKRYKSASHARTAATAVGVVRTSRRASQACSRIIDFVKLAAAAIVLSEIAAYTRHQYNPTFVASDVVHSGLVMWCDALPSLQKEVQNWSHETQCSGVTWRCRK